MGPARPRRVGGPAISDPQQALSAVVAQNAILLLLTVGVFWLGVVLARVLGRKVGFSLSPLGFARPSMGLFAGAGLGFLVGVGALVVSLVLNPLSALVLESMGYPTDSNVQEPFMRGLRDWVGENPAVAVPAILLVVVVFGPFVEELVFRAAIFGGIFKLLRALARSFRGSQAPATGEPGGSPGRASTVVAFAFAALASSVFFALLHLEPVLLPALLVLAVALCALYARTGSLLPPVVAHATFNSFATLIIILGGLGVFDLPI